MPAFQSIESIVHAFGSVSMMLESTFHAVHSSFQAVLGVAEHFSKMKLQVSQVKQIKIWQIIILRFDVFRCFQLLQLFVLSSIFMQSFSTYSALPQTTHILENQFGGR